MKNACLILPNFKIKSELIRRPDLSNKQILISGVNGNKEIVLDYTSNINGISKGSLLKDVLLKIKNPIILQEDEKYYSELQDELIRNLLNLFDRIETHKYECIYIDISDVLIYPCDDVEIAEIIFDAIPKYLTAYLGFSTGKYSSYIAALLASPGNFKMLEFNKKTIGSLSTYLLPVSDDLKSKMDFLGLTDFKKIANLKRENILFQFGKSGGFIWDFVNGIDKSRIKPIELKDNFSKEYEFPDTTDNYDALIVAMESLVLDGFTVLQTANKYPKKISLICFVFGGSKWIKSITFKTHEYDKEYVINILKRTLRSYVFSGPIEKMKLEIDRAEYKNGHQLNLFSQMRKESSLKKAISEFKSRFDVESPVYKIRDFEPYSRIPERRQILVRYDP